MDKLIPILALILGEPTGAVVFWIIGGRKETLFLAIFNHSGWKVLRNEIVGVIILSIIYLLFVFNYNPPLFLVNTI